MQYCAGLSLAGSSDWRLPSRLELISVEDPNFDRTGLLVYVLQTPNDLARQNP